MEIITHFKELARHFAEMPRRRRVAVVCPGDEHTEYVVERCASEGLADFLLVGDGSFSPLVSELATKYLGRVLLYQCASRDEAARKGVELVRDGSADVLMKGNISTDNLLKAVLDKERGLLAPGRVMSHLTVAQLPAYPKLLLFSDAAVIPCPNLDQFDAMVRYDLAVCRKLGIAVPKVALVHFSEKTNPKFQATIDYLAIKERAAAGAYGTAYVDGPMDSKTACDAHSASVKGIASPVVGAADVLIFPNLEASNTFYKSISLFGGAFMAGIITGTSSPVVVPSRADSAESKFYSLALACVAAG